MSTAYTAKAAKSNLDVSYDKLTLAGWRMTNDHCAYEVNRMSVVGDEMLIKSLIAPFARAGAMTLFQCINQAV